MFPFSLRKVMTALQLGNVSPVHGSFMLNLVGIRTADDLANTFNDWLCVFRQVYSPEWQFSVFPITTDPGMYWREHPLNVDGVAILVPGYYPNVWSLGKHKGEYEALIQVAPMDVWRDDNKDPQLTTSKVSTGLFGIELHRASAVHVSEQVDKWSAGCQVMADPNDFAAVMKMVHDQLDNTPVKTFSYTLLEEKDLAVLA